MELTRGEAFALLMEPLEIRFGSWLKFTFINDAYLFGKRNFLGLQPLVNPTQNALIRIKIHSLKIEKMFS